MDLLGRWVRRVAFFALFLGVFSGIFQRVEAQVAGATISGSVKDPSGAAVSGAQVSITDAATGILHAATTDSSGFYSVPNLLPGKYDVKVLKDGFAPALVEGITLSVGAQQSVNLALAVGTATERVQVDSAAPTVELNTSAMTSEVDGNEIRELPLNGRDWAQLATLEPGVNAVRNQSPVGGVSTGDVVRALRGFGDQLSISGARPQQNNYRLDGNQHQRLHQRGSGRRAGQPIGGRWHSGVFGHHHELFGGIRQNLGRRDQCHQPLRDQPISRQRLRVYPQQRAGRAQLLRHRSDGRPG